MVPAAAVSGGRPRRGERSRQGEKPIVTIGKRTGTAFDQGPPARRRAVIVAGPHRSGTSALTRVLSLRGAALPNHLLPPARDNELGFWESQQIVDLHDEILNAAGMSWDTPRAFPRTWFGTGAARDFAERLRGVIVNEYPSLDLIVVKDPRLCHLVPLWLRVLKTLAVFPHFVLTLRNPFEVAASLRVRDGIAADQALAIWLHHMIAAERETRNASRSFVTYDALIDDWRKVLGQIAADADLVWPQQSRQADRQIDLFLTPSLRHHRQMRQNAAPDFWVSRVEGWFRLAAAGKPVPARGIEGVSRSLAAAEQFFRPVLMRYEDRLSGVPADRARSAADEAGPP